MASSLPSFDKVRLAQPADIKRMGSVTIAGFHTSQSFEWMQPNYSEHKIEALRTQRCTFRQHMMTSMDKVLIVVEDEYNPAENESCPDVTATEEGETPPQAGEKAVVGVAMFEVPKQSKRIGDFQNIKAIEVNLLDGNGKDRDDYHRMKWSSKEAAAKKKHFPTDLYLTLLVVHPAYERRGHGADLVRWGIQLAQLDHLNIGLIASEVASPMYKRLGFEFIQKFDLEGNETSPRGIHYEVMKLESNQKNDDDDDNKDKQGNNNE